MRGPKSGSESGRTESQKFNAWNSDRCHSLHNSSFVSFLSLQLIGLINHIECRSGKIYFFFRVSFLSLH